MKVTVTFLVGAAARFATLEASRYKAALSSNSQLPPSPRLILLRETVNSVKLAAPIIAFPLNPTILDTSIAGETIQESLGRSPEGVIPKTRKFTELPTTSSCFLALTLTLTLWLAFTAAGVAIGSSDT